MYYTNLFNQLNGFLQVHTEVDKLPVYSFLLVFLLFQYEHVVVEELLQTLVGVVDAQLFEGVVLQEEELSIGFTDEMEKFISDIQPTSKYLKLMYCRV